MENQIKSNQTGTANAVELEIITSKKALLKPLDKAECVFRSDPEYRDHLPVMPEDTFEALEATIKRDGFIKDSLVIHHGKLLDGYARFDIATKYSLDYSVVELDVETMEEALIWLTETHCSRRNLSKFSIIEMFLKLKPYYEALAKRNLGRKKEGCSDNEQDFQPINTLQKIADKADSSRTTAYMVEKILEDPIVAQQCRGGTKSISQGYFAVKDNKDDDNKMIPVEFTNPQKDFINTTINGEVIDIMKQINVELAGRVSCILTSPPYNCLDNKYGIDMDGNSINDNKDYYDEYLPWLGECIVEFTKALRPGGRMIFNIDAIRHQLKTKGDSFRHTIYPDLINLVKKVAPELRFYHEIIWHKTNPKIRQFTGTRYSCKTPQLNRSHEYILVWSKSKDSFELPNLNNAPTDIDSEEWAELTSSVWNIPSDRTSKKYPHPAKMNPKIAERLIKLYSYADSSNIILDPFCGSGTSVAKAEEMGRSHISIDLNPNFCDMTQRRIAEVIAEKNKAATDTDSGAEYCNL
ncbi:MAG: DNA modification methylase [Phycisphaerae bacterium]|nr:DNA modification methylase [Phycisphaerae bacterium]